MKFVETKKYQRQQVFNAKLTAYSISSHFYNILNIPSLPTHLSYSTSKMHKLFKRSVSCKINFSEINDDKSKALGT